MTCQIKCQVVLRQKIKIHIKQLRVKVPHIEDCDNFIRQLIPHRQS